VMIPALVLAGSLMVGWGKFEETVPVPQNYSELVNLQPQSIVITGAGNGTAQSLIRIFTSQESMRDLRGGTKPALHQSLLARPGRRQETAATATSTGAAAAAEAPAAAPAPTAAPIAVATLTGSYRPAEMSAFIRVRNGIFETCADVGPQCVRLVLEREGGAQWKFSNQTVVAKDGYAIEGYDYTGPECAAFRLTYNPLPAGADGTKHVRFSLAQSPTWPPNQAADCTMILYEIPTGPVAAGAR